MYLNRKKKGFGWYCKVVSKDTSGDETIGYADFSFKKGSEPTKEELNDKGSYEGDLYFHAKDGTIRKVFPIASEYNGRVNLEWKIMNPEGEEDHTDNFGGPYQNIGESLDVSPEELPFY